MFEKSRILERKITMIYVITHGERAIGPDPLHTEKGIEKIKKLPLPENITQVVIGTGRRFVEIYNAFKDKLNGVPVKFSPFCGSAVSLGEEENIILPDGTVIKRDDYLSLYEVPAFNAWEFIRGLPDNTLLCSGGELLISLGLKSEKGCLFELDPVNKTGRKIG